MPIVTLYLLECRIVVEDAGSDARHIRTGVRPIAMLKLLTHLAYCGRYARIHSNDSTQTYAFAPVRLCRQGTTQ